MPSHDEHCRYTFERYGVTGEEIHEWMDEPVKLYGPTHRKARHDPNQKLPQYLIQIYGESLAKNIMIDHILQDAETKTGEKLLYENTHPKEKVLVDLQPVDSEPMAKQVTETTPFSIQHTIEQAKQRARELVDIFHRRNWTHEERGELKTLVEYLEVRG